MLEDRYALLAADTIFIAADHAPVPMPLMGDPTAWDERRVVGWSAYTTVTLYGELEEEH